LKRLLEIQTDLANLGKGQKRREGGCDGLAISDLPEGNMSKRGKLDVLHVANLRKIDLCIVMRVLGKQQVMRVMQLLMITKAILNKNKLPKNNDQA
jgi:hypothetical protein